MGKIGRKKRKNEREAKRSHTEGRKHKLIKAAHGCEKLGVGNK